MLFLFLPFFSKHTDGYIVPNFPKKAGATIKATYKRKGFKPIKIQENM
jgi:hypothetical protein